MSSMTAAMALVLVGGFLETESVGKGIVVMCIEREGVAGAGGTHGHGGQQFGGGVARLLGGAALAFSHCCENRGRAVAGVHPLPE